MAYQIVDEKIIGKVVGSDSSFTQMKLMHIICDTATEIPEPEPEWSSGSRCDILENGGNVYLLSTAREWKPVNFYNRGGGSGDFDPDNYYTKSQTDSIISGKVDKVTGKGLSTEDYTTAEKTKLSGIANGATNIGKLYPVSVSGEIFNNYTTNKASGRYSHAEGSNCTASGDDSHAEGGGCVSSGSYSHVEGNSCVASGHNSHASGYFAIAKANDQTAIGRCNLSDDNGTYAFIIGNGSTNDTRSNAFAVDWNGLIYVGNSATGVNVANLVEKEQGKGLSTEDFTTSEKNKLAGIDDYANYIAVDSVISSVSNNPVKGSVIYTALGDKVDKVTGKGLSTEDFTTAEKTKLSGIETGAEANIQSNWTQSDSTADDFIKNKPTLGSAASRSVVLSLSNAGSGLPTSGTVYSALENKVDKVTGKGLSTEDYTTAEKNSLSVLSELSTTTVTIDLNSQTWTQSANGLFYTGNISVTNLYRVFSTIITGFSALKATDNVAVIANSDKTAIRLTASTNTFSNQANITVSVFGRFTSSS